MKFPLLYLALFWVIGLLSGYYLSIELLVLLVVSGVFFLLSLFLRSKTPAILIIIFLLGLLQFKVNKLKPDNHISKLLSNHKHLIQPVKGRIISEVKTRDKGYEFILELEEMRGKKISGRIRVFSRMPDLEYGDVIAIACEISSPSIPTNPSGFDYAGYLSKKNIYGFGFQIDCGEKISSRKNWLIQVIIEVRKFIRNRIETRFGKYAPFIKAILIGDRAELEEMKTIMNRAGLSHLLAVSGLHVGLLSLILFSVLSIPIRSRNLSRILLIVILLVYAALCSWSASVFRAVVMISLYLVAKIIQKKPQANNILAAALLIITSFDPNQLFTIGFQMSFLAVYVLLNVIPKLKLPTFKKLPATVAFFLRAFISLELVTVCLTIFLAPLTMLHFNQLNFNGILGNLLGIPLISLLLPLAILIIFLPGFIPILEIYQASFKGLMFLFENIAVMSSRFPLRLDFIRFGKEQFWLIYASLFLIFSLLIHRKFRKFKILGLSLLILITLGFTIQKNKAELIITFFDCGLGDLCLLQMPDGENVMIDCGPTERERGHFRYSALSYFQKNGLKEIDHLFITHAHNDHYGGFESILEETIVSRVYLTDEFQTRRIWPLISEFISKEGSSLITVKDTFSLQLGEVKLKIIHPAKAYSHNNINNLSIVIRLDYDEFSALFCGDLEEEGEEYLLEHYPLYLDCDMLKVGHHGSSTSSTPEFINSVTPEFAFISTSLKNRFNFPHQVTLNKYAWLEERLIVSGKDGALQVKTDGKRGFYSTVLSFKEFVQ